MDTNKILESSFGRINLERVRVINFNDFYDFMIKRTSGDKYFSGKMSGFFTVLYRTLDAVASFELDHHGPVTTNLLKAYCNKEGIIKLKNLVLFSKVKYRKGIFSGLNEVLEYSDIYIDLASNFVRTCVFDYENEQHSVY